MRRVPLVLSLVLLTAGAVWTQESSSKTSGTQSPPSQSTAKAPVVSANARITGAKTVYMKKGRGSEIPYDVISNGIEGWGRYQLVNSPEKADLIIEVTAPSDSSGVSVSSSTGTGADGRPEQSTKTTRELSGSSMITLTVLDAKNNVPLWRGSEQAKSAMKQKAREDNMVEAAQKLLAKFRDRVEPLQ